MVRRGPLRAAARDPSLGIPRGGGAIAGNGAREAGSRGPRVTISRFPRTLPTAARGARKAASRSCASSRRPSAHAQNASASRLVFSHNARPALRNDSKQSRVTMVPSGRRWSCTHGSRRPSCLAIRSTNRRRHRCAVVDRTLTVFAEARAPVAVDARHRVPIDVARDRDDDLRKRAAAHGRYRLRDHRNRGRFRGFCRWSACLLAPDLRVRASARRTAPWTSSTPLMKRTWPGRSIARLRDPSPKECRKPGDQRWPLPNWITTSPTSRLLPDDDQHDARDAPFVLSDADDLSLELTGDPGVAQQAPARHVGMARDRRRRGRRRAGRRRRVADRARRQGDQQRKSRRRELTGSTDIARRVTPAARARLTALECRLLLLADTCKVRTRHWSTVRMTRAEIPG